MPVPPRVGLSPQPGDPDVALEQQLRGEVPERDHDARVDQGKLLTQEVLARVDLLGARVTVARGSALDHVGDVDILAFDPDLTEQAVEQLAGGTDERNTLEVFIRPGRFTDEHQIGFGTPVGKHDMGPGLGEGACSTHRSPCPQLLEQYSWRGHDCPTAGTPPRDSAWRSAASIDRPTARNAAAPRAS